MPAKPELSVAQVDDVQRGLERIGGRCVVVYQRAQQGRRFRLAGPLDSFRDATVVAAAPPRHAVSVAVQLRHAELGGILLWSSESPAEVGRLPGATRAPSLEAPPPSQEELADAIYAAAGAAFRQLFAEHPRERFYYCTLTTTGSAPPPTISAWSHEALTEVDAALAWSYADSPYCNFGDHHFAHVAELFARRPEMSSFGPEEAWGAECELRLRAMESAMARLSTEGLFGRGPERLGVVVAVEVMPPDWTNRERVMRLNPPEALRDWLEHAAEPAPERSKP